MSSSISPISSAISDNTVRSLHVALDGLDARQRAISSNLANLETPNYHAHQVAFEDSLRQAMQHNDPTRASISSSQSMAATRLNGNNVNIDFETMAGSENLLRQKLVIQALNSKFTIMRTSITG